MGEKPNIADHSFMFGRSASSQPQTGPAQVGSARTGSTPTSGAPTKRVPPTTLVPLEVPSLQQLRSSLRARFGSRWHDAVGALKTSPFGSPRSAWVLVPAYGAFALIVGFGSGILSWTTPTLLEAVLFPIGLLIFPSLIEEFVFRGLLLPRSLADARPIRQVTAIAGSTALFVVYHPLNARFVSLSDTSLFTTLPFLAIVTALGVTCSVAYLRSRSLWAPIAIHWATVLVWNLFLGRPR